ncbi:hypothetical protein ACN47E_002841 [Coniothyrium glycines]
MELRRDMASNIPEKTLHIPRRSTRSRTSYTQKTNPDPQPDEVESHDSDDDLEADLAKAALMTGTTAFESQQWIEAESLLQEALRVLEQLPKDRRTFCDIFDLHYKLSICTYYTQDLDVAEEALISLSQHELGSDAQRGRMCEATHLLSQLYIRTGRVDLAKAECEKTLQIRRRLLGKRSDASLESVALMAHIYVLLDNRALAKSYLAMIPEERREALLKRLGLSLGMGMGHLEFSSIMYSQPPESSFLATKRTHIARSVTPVAASVHGGQTRSGQRNGAAHSPAPSCSSIATSADGAKIWQSPQRNVSEKLNQGSQRVEGNTTPSSASATLDALAILDQKISKGHNTTASTPATSGGKYDEQVQIQPSSTPRTMSRKDILDKVGCRPRDNIEEAVCESDHQGLARLLNKERKALHFAALFGEVDMARRLLAAHYNINEIPFGYSTHLTPLHFAIGARQVEMVRFLLANNARPVEPDTWSTLASQLMNRSWLLKTLSDSEKDTVAQSIIAILDILLDAGWQINTRFGAAGGTILHQAVAFWTGSYKMDLDLRIAVALFLCSRGADPMIENGDGATAWDIASREGHHDLLRVLSESETRKGIIQQEPVELPGHC